MDGKNLGGGRRGGVLGQAKKKAGLWTLCCAHHCLRWLKHQSILILSFASSILVAAAPTSFMPPLPPILFRSLVDFKSDNSKV